MLRGVIDAMPDAPARRVLKLPPAKIETGPLQESAICPERAATEVIQEATARVLALRIDPESPESLMLRPKRHRWVCKRWTQWVKSQSCMCCGGPADDPHHIIGYGMSGMGTKSHDIFTIPLCRREHDELHRDPRAFEEKQGSQLELLFRLLDHAFGCGVITIAKMQELAA